MNDSEVQAFKDANTEAEWNAACDAIKGPLTGAYPEDYYATIVQSGIMSDFKIRTCGGPP